MNIPIRICITAERRKLLNKNTRTRVDIQMIGTNKNTFQLELKNRLTALEERDDINSLNKGMTEMNQQSAMSIAKQTKKQKNPKISSPTRALMKKRREMIENKTPKDHIEYLEIVHFHFCDYSQAPISPIACNPTLELCVL